MFFIMGMGPVTKKIDFQQNIVCSCCGRFGRLELYITYLCFSFFFIPLFKWNKRYFVTTTCCQTSSVIDKQLAEKIISGEIGELDQNELHYVCHSDPQKQCGACGFITDRDHQYCPKCGQPFPKDIPEEKS